MVAHMWSDSKIMQLKQSNCKDCMGWSIMPIPPVELGL